MASRGSLNKVLLIGNLTRDPELRYTPSGAAVCTFGLATNRVYTAADGTRKEDAEFHRIVAWNKLAELCSQLLVKGRKVYVEGRLQTRSWTTPAGDSRQMTEIVIDDMKILDKRPEGLEEIPETLPVEEPGVSFEDEVEQVEQVAPEQVEEKIDQKSEGKTETQTKKEKGVKKEAKSKPSKEEATIESESHSEEHEESTEDLIKDLPF